MALVSHIEALIRERYLKGGKLQEMFFKEIPLFGAIARKTNLSGGREIVQRIRYKGMAAGTVKGYQYPDTFSSQKGDFATHAKFYWKNIVASIVMAGEDIRMANTKEDLINFVDEHMEHALLGAKAHLNDMLINSTGIAGAPDYSKEPDGFARVFADNTATYGGIDPAVDIATWLAQRHTAQIDISTPSAASLTELKYRLIDVVADNSSPGMRPDVIACNRGVYNKLYEYALTKQYIVTTVAQSVKGKKLAEMGFTGISIDGVPIVVDPGLLNNHAYSWSDKSLWLQVHPKANFNTLPDGNGKPMMMEKINRADAYAYDIVIMCQLISPERRALGVCTNIKIA